MQIVALLSAIAAIATTLVAASPLETVVETKLGGVQYASHVKFANQLSKRNTPPPSGGGNGKLVYYGVIPDQGGSCAGGCGSNSNPFNNLCSVASHELVEATTDPAIGVVTGAIGSPAAWYDSADGNAGGEIGDICNGQQGTVNGYTVQKEWSNKAGACVVN
ncbi:hypothetical protein HDU76_004747 [Blyttiomyces sp. JEL0837]|nr:hypothetical protein HDU76_004747 [Blyttiomyces sp. JEL0837]